jgi:hypothetical protein
LSQGTLNHRHLIKGGGENLGNLAWAIPAIPFAHRNIQRLYITQSARADGNLSSKIQLDEESRAELDWWSTLGKLDGFDLGKHPLVVKLMRGVYNKKPPPLNIQASGKCIQ